jgi:hypothetical protein
MTATVDGLDVLDAVKKCQSQIEEMKRAGCELNPVVDCAVFGKHVLDMQALALHVYQLTARAAIRTADPKEAAMLWK